MSESPIVKVLTVSISLDDVATADLIAALEKLAEIGDTFAVAFIRPRKGRGVAQPAKRGRRAPASASLQGRVLTLLGDQKERTAHQIAEALSVENGAVLTALSGLRVRGLVNSERRPGRATIWSLSLIIPREISV